MTTTATNLPARGCWLIPKNPGTFATVGDTVQNLTPDGITEFVVAECKVRARDGVLMYRVEPKAQA